MVTKTHNRLFTLLSRSYQNYVCCFSFYRSLYLSFNLYSYLPFNSIHIIQKALFEMTFAVLQIFPILIFVVVVANVLVAIVLSKKHMITPTNVVLKYMAIADLCVGLVPLPWTFFYHSLGYHLREDRLRLWWCYMYKYSMDAVPPVCHNIAMWLTVLLAGQR